MIKRIKLWLDNLQAFLYALYNPWDVADAIRKIQRDSKPRIKAYSVDYLIWINADKIFIHNYDVNKEIYKPLDFT